MSYHVVEDLLFVFSPAKVKVFQYLSMLLSMKRMIQIKRWDGIFYQIKNNIKCTFKFGGYSIPS